MVEGLFIDVCSYGAQCLPCGVAGKTAPGEWAGVYCLGGKIEGNIIKVNHPFRSLELCEIEIFGKSTG